MNAVASRAYYPYNVVTYDGRQYTARPTHAPDKSGRDDRTGSAAQ